MAEDQFAEQIIPGTFVRVQAEALISAGGISSGNIGIVGSAVEPAGGFDQTFTLSDYESARTAFGAYDAFDGGNGTLNLTRGIELLFRNGARTVYARAVAAGSNQADFAAAFDELIKDNVNILVAPELATATAQGVLGLVDGAEDDGKDLMAVIGSDAATVANINGQVAANKRIILVAPGVQAFDSAAEDTTSLPGTYAAAAVAGLLSSLSVQSSPTNKVLSGVTALARRFSYGEMRDLVQGGVCVLEERRGIRVVRGITTEAVDNGPFTQITTRRITDFAKAGIRQVANPFIGRLNNQRVRKALQGAIDGFLTTMVQDESLTTYSLEVTATRQDEIAGRANVNVVMQPTFSIDYIRVTLALQ
jgi:Phage tail sheath protein subtilisin-like domain/Phage tail sheath C-terminal domain